MCRRHILHKRYFSPSTYYVKPLRYMGRDWDCERHSSISICSGFPIFFICWQCNQCMVSLASGKFTLLQIACIRVVEKLIGKELGWYIVGKGLGYQQYKGTLQTGRWKVNKTKYSALLWVEFKPLYHFFAIINKIILTQSPELIP